MEDSDRGSSAPLVNILTAHIPSTEQQQKQQEDEHSKEKKNKSDTCLKNSLAKINKIN